MINHDPQDTLGLLGATIRGIARRASLQNAREEEDTLRWLLGYWVSEMEPRLVYQGNVLVGLCAAAVPVGIKPFVLKVWA